MQLPNTIDARITDIQKSFGGYVAIFWEVKGQLCKPIIISTSQLQALMHINPNLFRDCFLGKNLPEISVIGSMNEIMPNSLGEKIAYRLKRFFLKPNAWQKYNLSISALFNLETSMYYLCTPNVWIDSNGIGKIQITSAKLYQDSLILYTGKRPVLQIPTNKLKQFYESSGKRVEIQLLLENKSEGFPINVYYEFMDSDFKPKTAIFDNGNHYELYNPILK